MNNSSLPQQFADYDTSKMLKELGFDEECFGYYEDGGRYYLRKTFTRMNDSMDYYGLLNQDLADDKYLLPLWQQVEEWLWKEHEIGIFPAVAITEEGDDKPFYVTFIGNEGLELSEGDQFKCFDSPITAKNEGIRAAVKHLYLNQKK